MNQIILSAKVPNTQFLTQLHNRVILEGLVHYTNFISVIYNQIIVSIYFVLHISLRITYTFNVSAVQ